MINSNETTLNAKTKKAKISLIDAFSRAQVQNWLRKMNTVAITIQDDYGVIRSAYKHSPALVIRIHDSIAYRRMLFGGTMGAAEAYMDGQWSTDDLAEVCRAFASQSQVIRSMDSGIGRLKLPVLKLWNAIQRNTRAGSRRNIEAHYDLNNEFFKQFLDPSMTYSSGYFKSERSSMEEASTEKNDRLCRQLELKPSDHILEIGCGWGGFACHAASTYGCKVTAVTISQEQFNYAQERICKANLESLIDLRYEDYRDIKGQFNKIVSIEMIEAVGHEYYAGYFKKCQHLLRPEGLLAIQAITIADQMYDHARKNVDFIKRYIFPGGGLPSLTKISELVTKHTDLNILFSEDIGIHYAKTLEQWHERFLKNEYTIRGLGFDDRFMRMWQFYLAYCEAGFRERLTGVSQIVFARPGFRQRISNENENYSERSEKPLDVCSL